MRQHVNIAPAQVTKEQVLRSLRLLETCIPHSDVDCMVWWGDVELRQGDQLPVLDGYSIFTIYNQLHAELGSNGASSSSTVPIAARSSPADDLPPVPCDEENPLSLLQVHTSQVRRVILLEQSLEQSPDQAMQEQERRTGNVVAHAYRPCSASASTTMTFAQLWSVSVDMQLPTFIEIPHDGKASHVVDELRHWGHQCRAIRFGDKPLYLCIPDQPAPVAPCHHYAYHHDDLDDPQGAILHTSMLPMTRQQHLMFLCDLGYDRAVLTYVGEPDFGYSCINFIQCNPSSFKHESTPRQRTAWPERQISAAPIEPLYQFQRDNSTPGPCRVRTPFDHNDLRTLFEAGTDFLCQDFTLFPLPEFVQQALQMPDSRLVYNRWLIYTDGSSQSKLRHHTPEYVDAHDQPDSWAMLVVGEKYQDDGSSIIHPIGWTAHTVRYDEAGANFAGARRIGAEVAEREGTFQFLKIGLPPGHLGLHHVRAHAGDPFNEFVDLAAKREAQQSFNHPRMPLNMQSWQHKVPYLWLLFADRLGLPSWNDGLCVIPPNLPSLDHGPPETAQATCSTEVVRCDVSLATINVMAISKAPDGHAGRLHFLYEQVKSFGLNIIGIQEGRNPESLSQTNGIYRICAGDDHGQLGVEFWVNLQQPVGHDATGRPIHLQPRCFKVAHRDPRRLIVRCDHEILTGWFLVAHGPHSGTPAMQRREWWQQTEDLIHSHSDGCPWFWLIDANAAPGPADGITVFEDNLMTSTNTSLFRECLAACELCLPSTSDCHQGERSTWTAPNGQDRYCIDYIAVPQTWLSACVYSGVIHNFELGHLRDDHFPVALQLTWHTSRLRSRDCARRRVPDVLWSCPTNRSTIRSSLEQLLPPSWCTDVTQQAAQLTQDLTGVLTQAVQKPLPIKKPYIDLPIWNLRSQKLQQRKKLGTLNCYLVRHRLAHFFRAWRHPPPDEVTTLAEHQYEVSLHCWRLRAYFAHRASTLQLRQALRTAKARVLNTTLSQLDEKTSASYILHCLRGFIGPTNLKHCKRKTIPFVKDCHGHVCHTAAEALDTWVEFFRKMEGGQRMSWQTLRTHWHAALIAGREDSLCVEATELPTLTDLEIAMRRTACGRARGQDAIPGELLHHCPTQIAALVYPSLWKLMLHGQEDLMYKGGKLIQAYKGRGERDSCSSFRSLLISSRIGKSIHRTIRSHQADIFERFLQKQQVGGKRKKPVTYGLHLVRAHLRCARRAGRSAAVFFVDLTEAFYRIFRPLCMDNGITDEALAAFLHKLQVPPSALQELWKLLDGPNALDQAEAPYLIKKSIAAIHHNTHFWMESQSDVIETEFGSRPGDPFADVVFTYVWARVLHRLQAFLETHQFLTLHPHAESLRLFPDGTLDEPVSAPHDPQAFIGPTWMDDTAICLDGPTPKSTIERALLAAGKLLELCTEHGLSPNLKKGKTELLLSLRGRHSRQAKLDLFGPDTPGTIPVITEHQVLQLPLTQQYLHLGGLLHHQPDQRGEVRRRLAQAHAAFTQHRRLLYHNAQIPFSKRRELFQVLVLTKLMYGAESWFVTDNHTIQYYHAAVLRLYRRLLRVPHDQHLYDDELLAKVGLPAPDILIRRQRLRYLCTLLQSGMDNEWGLLSADRDWCNLMEDDLTWMWLQLQNCSSLKSPATSYNAWRHLIIQHPGYWKKLIRRAVQHSVFQTQRLWRIKEFYMASIPSLCQIFDSQIEFDWDIVQPALETHFGCLHCKLRCATRAGEAAHMCKAHKIVAKIRYMITEPSCPACLKFCHTMQKTKAHVYYSERCRRILQSRGPALAYVPGAGSLQDQARAAQHDRLLPPIQAHGPLNCAPRLRDDPGIDDEFFLALTEGVVPHLDISQYIAAMENFAEDHPISWTTWCRTLIFFEESFTQEDAEYATVPLADFHGALRALCRPDRFDFLMQKVHTRKSSITVEALEASCMSIGTSTTLIGRPQGFGRHRVLLHAFAGRRRVGDIQYFMEQLIQSSELDAGFVLHIVSLDIVIDEYHGDVMKPEVRRYWLDTIRDYKVAAFLAGPPCETWSAARENPLEAGETDASARGPRVLRDHDFLWGFESLALRELAQILVGNELLLFAFEAFLGLVHTQGVALLEHPAEPQKEQSASIWKIPFMQKLVRAPNVERRRFAQGLLGAPTPKPTELLALNLPGIMSTLHKWRVRCYLPKNFALGKNQQGEWRTAVLKGYPPAMCGALADSVYGALCDLPNRHVQEPPQQDLDLWHRLTASTYGACIGPDYAG
eukprot:s5056_g2.t1